MSLQLTYKGPSVADGKMNVYDAAANMVAFSNFVIAAAHQTHGQESHVTAEVKAFKHGSFETDLIFHVAGVATSLLAATPDAKLLISTLKESLDLFKFLRGERPQATRDVDNRSIEVTNVNGSTITVNQNSYYVTVNAKAGEAVEQFVGAALSKPGVDSIDIASAGQEVMAIPRADADFYRTIDLSEDITDTTVEMVLTIANAEFREDKKWTFSDGEHSFTAAILDEAFLSMVDEGEAFRKGDSLVCKVRIQQSLRPSGALKTTRTVIAVVSHIRRPEQQSFLN